MISSSGSGGLVNSVNTCFEVVTVPLHTFSRLLSLFFPPIGPTFFVYLILFSHLTDPYGNQLSNVRKEEVIVLTVSP